MSKIDKQFERIEAVIGRAAIEDFDKAAGNFFKHLTAHLELPCEVTGIDDFRWEEPYVIGGWSLQDYKKLKKTQPSYTDRFQLISIEPELSSEWMMCGFEDIGAHVKRSSDGKKFVLGLSELKATDKKSSNFRLIDDYAVFFWNNR